MLLATVMSWQQDFQQSYPIGHHYAQAGAAANYDRNRAHEQHASH